MTLIEHLEELRSRLIYIAIALVVATIVTWIFRGQIFYWLVGPSEFKELTNLGPAQGLITDVKLSLFSALVLTIPLIIYHTWMFVAPAVGTVGRVFTYILVIMSSLLFLAGIAFTYYVVLPVGLSFLYNYAPERYVPQWTTDTYLPFVTRSLLGGGIVFELPAATFVGAKLGFIGPTILKRYRKHSLIVNALVAAALTPSPDPFSMLLLAIPLILMYEVSILIARFVKPFEGIADPEEPLPDYDDEDEDEEETPVEDEPARERDL
jgi:sec-independent protein translocase protein TatC